MSVNVAYQQPQQAYTSYGSKLPDGATVITTQPVVNTTVVTQQLGPNGRAWGTGTCDCCEDLKSCCLAFFCCHFYFACIAARMGENCCVGCSGEPAGCVPGGHIAMRSRFRATHGIQVTNDVQYLNKRFYGLP